jgi:peroxiredoxin
LAAWEPKKAELAALGCTVYAISVDTREQAQQMARESGISYPMAYGLTKEESDSFGAWWIEDQHGPHNQPTEFLLGRGGTVLGSMYTSGQVGRMAPEEAIRLITARERRRLEQEATARGG